ncbi:low-temperature-induced 78 kDa protein isoform X3 [Carya illinoinensis]|uniref:low-temperature-induced 78 kDa protein isoform X3 n=1 Tax=Carya illinoinensis TaxID=32201 RepID=UPI001C7272AD|nr:low-temperature-induced 78 kDa protein isoform X3 [Carya illinoinensis]
MDSRIEHPQGTMHADDSQNAGLLPLAEGREDEQSNEKTSVLTKVKAKAKKIKDTLKKYGHGHDHDDEHHPDERYIPDDHDLDEEKKMVEDPEVHAGTESKFVPVRSAFPVETENAGKSKLDFGRSAATREDAPSPGERHESKIIKPIKGIEPNTGQPMFKFGNPMVSGENPHAPQNTPISPPLGDYGTKATDPTKTLLPGEEGTGQPKVNLERPMGLEEDPHMSKDRSEPHTPSIYQTKVIDSTGTGGEEVGIAPNFQSFDKMKVHDESKPKQTKTLLPDEEGTRQPKVNLERPTSLEEDPPEPKDSSKPHNPAIYQTKVTDPTGTGGEEAGIAPILQSFDKMKIHDEPKPKPTKTFVPGEEGTEQPKVNLERPMGMEEDSPAPKDRSEPHTPAIYQKKVMDPLGTGGEEAGIAPILQSFDKMKVHDEPKPKPTKAFVPSEEGTGKPKVNLEKPMGLEEDPRSRKDISELHTHAIYQTKVTDPTGTGSEEAGIAPIPQSFDKMEVHDELKPKPTGADDNSPTSIRKQFPKSPTGRHDQFSPEPVPSEAKIVRDKSKHSESFDATKLPDDTHDISEEPMNEKSSTEKTSYATSAIADKAISVKNAVASKLGYGEKDMTSETEVRQRLDTNEKPEKGEMQPTGKGTEAEVARQLGTKEDNYNQGMQSSDVNNSPGKGMVNTLKGAVGSWFGLGGESQPQVSAQPHGSSYGNEGISPSANEDGGNSSRTTDEGRRLQEK